MSFHHSVVFVRACAPPSPPPPPASSVTSVLRRLRVSATIIGVGKFTERSLLFSGAVIERHEQSGLPIGHSMH